jgi:hypothetical protein
LQASGSPLSDVRGSDSANRNEAKKSEPRT